MAIRDARTGGVAAEEPSVGVWAWASLAVMLASIAVWPAFVAWGGIWFTISDSIGLVFATVTIPVIVGLDRWFSPHAPALAGTARWIGLAGMVAIGAGSILLVAGQVNHEFQPAQGGLGVQIAGYGLWGVWLLLTAELARRAGTLGRAVVVAGYTIGAAIVLGMVGATRGPDHPITVVAGATLAIGLVAWTVAVARATR